VKKRDTVRGVTGIAAVVSVGIAGLVMAVLRQPDGASTQVINRDSTRIVVNGQKIFPIGMYHTSWAGDNEEKYSALEAIAAAGFNAMHPALDLADQEFLDRAEELGVYLVVEADDPEGPEAMFRAFQDEPIILAWNVADDFNSISNPKSPANIAALRDDVKALTPNHLTYMSGNNRNLEQYAGLSDVTGIQTFSIPSDPLNLTHQMLTFTIETTGAAGDSVFANLQSYTAEGRRVPTNDEIRNITYQALITGVDGIFYYTYFDEVWDMEDYPTMWQGLTQISAEVRQLTPMLLDGELMSIPSGHPSLLLGQWSYENRRYLVVINWTEDTLNNITLPVTARSMTPMFPERPAGFALQNNTLTGSIGATAVDVYILED
jgi:hypothetical protein